MAEIHQKPTNPRFQDLTGRTFGRWKVFSFSHQDRHGNAYWNCQCQCEEQTIRSVNASNLSSGQSRSCGCLQRDLARAKFSTHGASRTLMYNRWRRMIERCRNRNHHAFGSYGGRGIVVCERWMVFENFLADMGSPPTAGHKIERRDNDREYAPDNCYWATPAVQANNRRGNILVEHEGSILTLREYAVVTLQSYNHVAHLWRVGRLQGAFKRGTKTKATVDGSALIHRPS